MGIFSRIKERFKKKESLIPSLEAPPTLKEKTLEEVSLENLKAKIDLILTRLDSLNIQNTNLGERIERIERLVTEIRGYCK
ncbi:MAG: hypothetical protein QXX38_00530 [Candidatus Aenigmatarchaeota archaeon]